LWPDTLLIVGDIKDEFRLLLSTNILSMLVTELF